jgi:putative flippase GtrA
LFEKSDNSLIQFLRSLVVGGIATVVDMAVLTICVEVFNFGLLISTAIGFVLGLIANFLISSLWVFKKSQVVKSRVTEFVVFAFIGVIGLLINEVIVLFFDGFLADSNFFGNFISADKYYLIGKLAATVVAFVWNFGARKILLYRDKK